MVCVICPTLLRLPLLHRSWGGSAASLTTYTLIANIGAAIAVPILFPLIEANPGISFIDAFLVILSKVFPLLICPFLAAWFLQRFIPKVHKVLLGYHELAFYLWGISLAIVTAQTLYSLINDPGRRTYGDYDCGCRPDSMLSSIFFLGKTLGQYIQRSY